MATAKKSRKGSKVLGKSRGNGKSTKAASRASSVKAKARPAAAISKKKPAKARVTASKPKSNGAKKTAVARPSSVKPVKRPKAPARVAAAKAKVAPKPTRPITTRKLDKETPVRKGKKTDLRPIKKELLERREQLLRKLNRLTATQADVSEKPVGDRADDASFDLELDSSYSIAEREAEELRLIDVALEKTTNGTYGICEECGGPIEAPRLNALPYAVMCLKCKETEELQRHTESSDIVYGRIEEE